MGSTVITMNIRTCKAPNTNNCIHIRLKHSNITLRIKAFKHYTHIHVGLKHPNTTHNVVKGGIRRLRLHR